MFTTSRRVKQFRNWHLKSMDCTEQPSVPEKKQNYRSLKYFISEMIKSNLAILRSESV